jgi:hypothetical protein
MLTTQTTGETYRRKYPLYTSIKIRHSNLEKIKFDSEENLLDENTKRFLILLLQNLSNWTRRLRENKTSSV